MMKRATASLAALLLFVQPAFAVGPLYVGGPGAGVPGVPLLWDNSKPIVYRVDAGPLSQRANGTVVIDNASGIARVNSMFGNWAAVPTANLNFSNAGGLLGIRSAGFPAGGDVQTVQQFTALVGDSSGQTAPDPNSCNGGGQSPIVFDADGSIFSALGLPPEVIGFAFACDYDAMTGRIISAGAILNGRFQDGIDDPRSGNLELTTDEFNQAFTHEFGHFLGLGHSQINVDLLLKALNNQSYTCTSDDTAGMPLMFPFLGICPAKVTSKLPIIAVDDAAWISKLYPVGNSPPAGKTSYNAAYGTISGSVLFTDGTTPVQGVNVIARSTNAPRRNAASAVSGYLFTGNPGQTTTCIDPAHPTAATCSNLGDPFGSRDTTLIGRFDIPLPPGTYSISVESVYAGFTGGSSLTPLDPPIPMPGNYGSSATVSVTAGGVTSINITLTGTQSRFDTFENAAINGESEMRWLRRKQFRLEWA